MAKKQANKLSDLNFTFIYGLICPISNDIRYVGKSNNPEQRFKRHLKNAVGNDTHHCANWIRSLNGKLPLLKIIERCPIHKWKERESFWILKYKSDGAELTNCKGGGDGADFTSAETREKQRLAKIGNSIHKGFKVSEDGKLRMSISAIEKFKLNPELKIAIRENQKKAAAKNRGLSEMQVQEVKKMFANNIRIGNVCKETNISYDVLEKIKQGKNYAWVRI
jgi:hypothetical protein